MKIINLVEDTAGSRGCRYEHGLSFYIETKKHKLLIDSGATDKFLYNADLLGVDVTQADTLILSHGHYDHSGGIGSFAERNPSARIYMKASAGEEYYHLTEGMEKYIGIDKKLLTLEQCVFVSGDYQIDDELFLFSGVTGTKYPARSNRTLLKKTGQAFSPDTFDHEQYLVITQGDHHTLVSGCAHKGIINILDRYYELYHAYPELVISGFHLNQKNGYTEEDIDNIKEIAHALLKTNAVFYTGHCTGAAAYDIMKQIMGDHLKPIHSGERLL